MVINTSHSLHMWLRNIWCTTWSWDRSWPSWISIKSDNENRFDESLKCGHGLSCEIKTSNHPSQWHSLPQASVSQFLLGHILQETPSLIIYLYEEPERKRERQETERQREKKETEREMEGEIHVQKFFLDLHVHLHVVYMHIYCHYLNGCYFMYISIKWWIDWFDID